MTAVIVVLKIMPASPETNLDHLLLDAEKQVTAHEGKLYRNEIQPIAFGLKALLLTIVVDEDKGSTDALEEKIAGLHGVESCTVTSVSRALG